MSELAARWRLHRTTVAHTSGALESSYGAKELRDDQRDEAVRLYAEGWSCRRLGERYHCDGDTVRQTFRGVGVALRAPWERV